MSSTHQYGSMSIPGHGSACGEIAGDADALYGPTMMASYRSRASGKSGVGNDKTLTEFETIELQSSSAWPLQSKTPSRTATTTPGKSSFFSSQPTIESANTQTHLIRETENGLGWLPWQPARSSSDALMGEQNAQRAITWPLGVQTALFVVAAVLLANAAITMWTSITLTVSDGIGTLHVGPCAEVKRTGLGLHILINFLGTLLLGASNFCMQCLSSPTRKEVDAQHAQKKWLEIGILSLRNLRNINRRRVWLWFFLGMTSFPIHLMFNSAVFVNLTANEYTVAVVSNDFVAGAEFTLATKEDNMIEFLQSMQQNISSYERLDPGDCIRTYGVDFLSSRRHAVVVLVETDIDPFQGYLNWTYDRIQNSWVCGGNLTDDGLILPEDINEYDCTISDALESLPIYFGDYEMDHCLSEKVVDACRLQFSLPIMLIVIVCNATKLICIATMMSKRETTLLTLGDAIASFLERPDLTTKGMCTLTIKDIKSGYWPDNPKPRRWEYSRHFRWEAVGLWRWVGSNALTFLSLAIFSTLLYSSISTTTTNPDLTTWSNLGFGTVTASSLVRWGPTSPFTPGTNAGLMRNVLLANSPQLLLSATYLVYNQAYTCMAFADEWASYFPHTNHQQNLAYYAPQPHKSLRLTRPLDPLPNSHLPNPHPHQNTAKITLSLPLRYTIPLLLLSGITHFLLSQAFFLVTISVFSPSGTIDQPSAIMTVGFSPMAMVVLFIIICGSVVFLGLGLGFRRLKKGMPLVGSCSAALSAACHVSEGGYERGEEVARGPVLWGVVGGSERGVGHLAFSGGVVGEPVPRRGYR